MMTYRGGTKAGLDTFLNDYEPTVSTSDVQIHTVDHDLEVVRVLSIDTVADYVKGHTDRVIVRGIMKNSDWLKRVIGHSLNLQVTIIRHYVNDVTLSRYKAVIPNEVLRTLNEDEYKFLPDFIIDRDALGMFELQCKLLHSHALSGLSVSGNYSQIPMSTLLGGVIDEQTKSLFLESRPVIDRVVITPPTRTDKVSQITIPTGINLLTYPSYLQERLGVYALGLSSYIKPYVDGTVVWWIQDVYNKERYNQGGDKLNITVAERNVVRNIKASYRPQGDVTHILCADTREGGLAGDTRQAIRPNVMNVVDTDTINKHPIVVKDGKVHTKGDNSFKSLAVNEHGDTVDYSDHKSTTTHNYYASASTLVANNTVIRGLEWSYSDTRYLVPCMPVQITYTTDAGVEIIQGNLVGHQSTLQRIDDRNPTQMERTVLFVAYSRE